MGNVYIASLTKLVSLNSNQSPRGGRPGRSQVVRPGDTLSATPCLALTIEQPQLEESTSGRNNIPSNGFKIVLLVVLIGCCTY